MNLHNAGAPRRPKLSLSFGRTHAKACDTKSTLSETELKRIVAAMIG